MSGKNTSILELPPGIFKESTQFATGAKWFDGNLIRWFNNILTPIQGWVKYFTLPAGDTYPVRGMFSWFDNSLQAWVATGSVDRCVLIKTGTATVAASSNDITPSDLAFNPASTPGFGGGQYGRGAFGKDSPSGGVDYDPDALWSFDNYGENLVAVHSQDGRLLMWSPLAPGADLAVVGGAPLDNRLVCVTDERHVMLFGGKNHPRRIKWSSSEDYSDWTPTETNSAGGYELDTGSAIIAIQKIQNGILVFTSVDVHLIQYVGAPFWYSRPKKITDITGILGQNCVTATPNGAIWVGASAFWKYDGSVSRIECSVQSEFFRNSYLLRTAAVFLATNEYAQEVWTFYPGKGLNEPNRYVLYSYRSDPFWSLGALSRTAMLDPVFQSNPLMTSSDGIVYDHERGDTADGATRNVYVTSGYIGLSAALQAGDTGSDAISTQNQSSGDNVLRIDRVWDDVVGDVDASSVYVGPSPLTVNINRKEAPNAPARPYGAIALGTTKGYTVTRLRARLVSITLQQIVDTRWGLGKLMFRVKKGGKR